MSLNADISIWFWVNNGGTQGKQLAVQLKLHDLFIKFNAIIDGMNVKANVRNATLGPVTVVTTFGALDMSEIKLLLDQVLLEGRPEFNKFLHTLPLQVPDTIFHLFKLSNLTLKFHNNFIEAGLTPTFLPLETPMFKQVENIETDPVDSNQFRYITTIDENDVVKFEENPKYQETIEILM